MTTTRTVLVRRLGFQVLGLVFLVVATLFIASTIAIYNKTFSNDVHVTLETDQAGNQMREGGDVKIRGLGVGEVRGITSDGQKATLDLALDPERIEAIPANVSARLLPKTLFGERYVSLEIPEGEPAEPIAAGDVISQDRSRSAVELERVLSNVMPLLQAVKPQKLSSTLSAVSNALDGRGEQLGDTLVGLSDYLRQFNPSLPDLRANISAVGDVAEVYNDAAPDFVEAMSDLTTTTRTLVEKREQLAGLYASASGAATDLSRFLEANEDNLIQLTTTAQPALDVLAKYAPQYPCMFRQFADSVPEAKAAFGVGDDEMNHVEIRMLATSPSKYEPGDEPEWRDKRGPRCYPQVPPPGRWPQYPPEGPIADGSSHPPPPKNSQSLPGPVLGYDVPFPDNGGADGSDDSTEAPGDENAGPPEGEAADLSDGSSGNGGGASTGSGGAAAAGSPGTVPSPANSPAEQRLVSVLQAPTTGIEPDELPGWGSVLLGPLYRGTTVELK